MTEYHPQKTQTVTELTRSIKGLLETTYSFVSVMGEISNLRRPVSGHYYFTLKDEEAQIRAVLFKVQQRYLAVEPEEGMKVTCSGRVSVYEPRGEYQLIVDTVDFKGTGALQAAFEELKQRLSREGLFDKNHKRPLPPLPSRIALVTSPTGAAVRDFLQVAGKRFPLVPMEIYPVRVQGVQAGEDIVEALAELNRRKSSQVIVLCRGGGSIEDLWAFNEEKVARAIFVSQIPVVSAVGHEIDFTIADFVADFRAPTPSAAAEILLPDKTVVFDRIQSCRRRMTRVVTHGIRSHREQVEALRRILKDPSSLLAHFLLLLDHRQAGLMHVTKQILSRKKENLNTLRLRLDLASPRETLRIQGQRAEDLAAGLSRAMQDILQGKKRDIERHRAVLNAVNPMATLERGYAIVMDDRHGQIIRESTQVNPGDEIHVILRRGRLDAEVTKVRQKSSA